MKIDNVKSFDQQLSLIFHAMLAGPLLFYCILYLNSIDGDLADIPEPSMTMKGAVAIICGVFVLAGFYFYRREITVARSMPTLKEKLGRLFNASLILYALIEFASIIAVLAYYLTYNHLFTAIYVAILFLMSLNRPIPEKYANDLMLKGDERNLVKEKRDLPDEGQGHISS